MTGVRRVEPARPATVVLLDTNALFLPFRERFPLESEIARLLPGADVRVPAPARREVERLAAAGRPHAGPAAQLARRFAAVPGAGEGDAAILAIARRLQAAVVTADGAFRERLLAAGVPVLSPRGLHRLVWTPGRQLTRPGRARFRGTLKNGPLFKRAKPKDHDRRRPDGGRG